MAFNPLLHEDLDHILTQTASLWKEIAGTRLFITGGTGFFGKWLLESISAANDILGCQITATTLSRNPTRFLEEMPHLAARQEFDWIKGDVRDFPFPRGDHDYVFHMATAASAKLNEGQPLEMLDTIVEGTRRTLAFARQCRARRLLMTSSGAVYGLQPSTLSHIPESYSGGPDPLAPSSAYAEGKRMAELLCRLTADVPCVIARCFAFIGPHLPLDAHFAAGNFLKDALLGDPINIEGDGRAVRSYLYASDLIIWLLTLLMQGTPGRAYNVGSNEALSIKELAERIALVAGVSSTVRIRNNPSQEPAHRYVPDTRLALDELGLKKLISLDEGVKKYLAWARTPVSHNTYASTMTDINLVRHGASHL